MLTIIVLFLQRESERENQKLFVFAAFLYEQLAVLHVLDYFVLGSGHYKILHQKCTKLKTQSLTNHHSN